MEQLEQIRKMVLSAAETVLVLSMTGLVVMTVGAVMLRGWRMLRGR
jgi:hypothetical protein